MIYKSRWFEKSARANCSVGRSRENQQCKSPMIIFLLQMHKCRFFPIRNSFSRKPLYQTAFVITFLDKHLFAAIILAL